MFALPAVSQDRENKEQLDKLRKVMEGLSRITRLNHCHRAIGNVEFCTCLSKHLPHEITFTEYIQAAGIEDEEKRKLLDRGFLAIVRHTMNKCAKND